MRVAVIGGGPAGMMAAIAARQKGADVTLYERNEKLGKKMYISGKGRCNVTNDCSVADFIAQVCTNPKFLYGALNKFSPANTLRFCEDNGLAVKVERGNRVFPASDKSSDVIRVFARALSSLGVEVCLNSRISAIEYQESRFLLHTITQIVSFDRVIIATGGVSYPLTGSTGDGYDFAKKFGHAVVGPKPALCRVLCSGTKALEGLSLRNVQASVQTKDGKIVDSEFGEMLFTDDGVSGPIILTLSSRINKLKSLQGCKLIVDLKPALTEEMLDERILRDFSSRMNKSFANALDDLLPAKMIPFVVGRSKISADKKINSITIAERQRLVCVIKNLIFDVVGLDDVDRAIVTSGGVAVQRINPATMESKIIPGLYFAGEVMDVDAYTGGFNIQIALSTGYVAGSSAAE